MTLDKSPLSTREKRRAARNAQRRNRNIIIAVLIILVLASVGAFVWFNRPADSGVDSPVGPVEGIDVITTDSGLQYQDLVVGDGAQAGSGNRVQVHYTGWLVDGTKFDSSIDAGSPFTFTIGAGRVIRGWEEGVAGMRVGGTRKLIIPPQLGYGAQGFPPVIPENATLIFDVELLEIVE